MIDYNWVLPLLVLGFFASIFGSLVIQSMLRQTGKTYYIVFLLAFSIGISALIIPLHVLFKHDKQ